MRSVAALVALAAVAAVAAAVPNVVRAQPVSAPSGPDTYLQIHGGAVVPRADVDRFDTGFDVGLVFGARFSRHVSAEAGIAYQRNTAGAVELGCPAGVICTIPLSLTADETLRVVPITASLRLRQPFKFAELSALGGVGVHLARLSSTVESGGIRYVDTFGTSAAFGFHVGAGVTFNVWPTTLVGVEVVQTFVRARFEGVATRIDGLRADATITYRL